MKMLKNGLVRDNYDVVVVGGGIGGLTTAAMLAKKGVNTLLIEQHYMPGGCCGAIRRQGITFDIGATVLYGFGEKGLNTHRFVMNELEEDIDMLIRKSIYHMDVAGDIITFWWDFRRFFDELVAVFPNQKKELTDFYGYCYDLYNVMTRTPLIVPPTEIPPIDNLKMMLRGPLGLIKMMSLTYKSATDLFNEFFTDPKIIAFFDMLTRTFSYVDSAECPAMLSASMFTDNHEGGGYYPVGSPQMLSNKLERAIERNGGQILYRHLVDEILISSNKAYGVRLSDGTEIMADRVVSNATIWNLYGQLVKPRHIKPKRMKWAHNFVPNHSNMILFIGLDSKAIPEGTHPMEIYINDPNDVAGHGITVYIPTLQDPGVSPPGLTSITITAVTTLTWPRPFDPDYQTEAYQTLKKQEAEKILDQVERHIPDFRKHIKVMDVATPTTLERFTLNNWGNVGGPKQALGQEMMKRLHARSDWKNLYLCGDSTVMGLGVLPATLSGVGAANMILKDMGLKEYRDRPFTRQYVHLVEPKPWTPPPDRSEPISTESAMRLAKECQHCKEPSCTKACPAEIDLPGFHRRVEAGNFGGAARSMREMNPLAEICGHICPSEKFCEQNCNRLDFSDQATRIADLHAWVCGPVTNNDGWNTYISPIKGVRIAIVGAGPAGLSCAHFLVRLGYQVDILEMSQAPGGIMAKAIPAFRLSDEIVERELRGINLPGMNLIYNQTFGTDFTVKDLEKDYEAIFLAPGLWSGRKLKVPGPKKPKEIDALSFLTSYRKKGKTTVGKKVLIIGGGSVAADAALAAKDLGAAKVTLVCLENKKEMPALSDEIAELDKQGIEIHNGWGPKAFISSTKMSFLKCKSIFDKKGCFRPSFDEAKSIELPLDQLIWAVGQSVEPKLAKYLKKEFGQEGLLEVTMETMQVKNRDKIFAGGDLVRGAGTVVEAVADGRRAAMAIDLKQQQK